MRAVLLALVILAAAVPTAAAGDTLGGRLSPTNLVWERDAHQVNLTNLSTVPVIVALTVEGDGWAVDESRVSLDVEERYSVPILEAGESEAIIRASFTPVDVPAGDEAAVLVLETKARHAGPWDSIPGYWPLLALLAVLVALAAAWGIRRRTSAPHNDPGSRR